MVGEAEWWTMETCNYFSITFVGLVNTWLDSVYIKVIVNSPQDAKDLHKIPGQWNHFVSVFHWELHTGFLCGHILVLSLEFRKDLGTSVVFQFYLSANHSIHPTKMHKTMEPMQSCTVKCKSRWYLGDYIKVAEHIDLLISPKFILHCMYFLSPY